MVDGKHVVIGIHVKNRIKDAGAIQKLFSEYGCNIKTRLGLHEVSEGVCAVNGLILLEMHGDLATVNEFKAKVKATEGLDIQEMVFAH